MFELNRCCRLQVDLAIEYFSFDSITIAVTTYDRTFRQNQPHKVALGFRTTAVLFLFHLFHLSMNLVNKRLCRINQWIILNRRTFASDQPLCLAKHRIRWLVNRNPLDCYGYLANTTITQIFVSTAENSFRHGVGCSVHLRLYQQRRQSDTTEICLLLHNFFGWEYGYDGDVV